MPNQEYISGRNFEYRVKAYLEKRGYKVVRSAGSHGPIDLLAGKSLVDKSLYDKSPKVRAEVDSLNKEWEL